MAVSGISLLVLISVVVFCHTVFNFCNTVLVLVSNDDVFILWIVDTVDWLIIYVSRSLKKSGLVKSKALLTTNLFTNNVSSSFASTISSVVGKLANSFLKIISTALWIIRACELISLNSSSPPSLRWLWYNLILSVNPQELVT